MTALDFDFVRMKKVELLPFGRTKIFRPITHFWDLVLLDGPHQGCIAYRV